MNILSVFIDESGDFGEKTNLKSYYLVTDDALFNCTFKDNCFHTGPIIRHEEAYKNLMID